MLTGIVFDIKELAVHDGPGIRTTVFLKGCPLRCMWCHNPEGLSGEPQIMTGPTGNRMVGQSYTCQELANILNRQADILRSNEGGVTFSGGEPLMQAKFVAGVIDRLDDLHVRVDTSGFGSEGDFRLLAGKADLLYFDLKLIDPAAHLRYTGADNTLILQNLQALDSIDVAFVVRVPLVPGVTDTNENLSAIAETIRNVSGLLRVELLPYNKAAGGKYRACGMEFRPDFDESQEVNTDTTVFEEAGLQVRLT